MQIIGGVQIERNLLRSSMKSSTKFTWLCFPFMLS